MPKSHPYVIVPLEIVLVLVYVKLFPRKHWVLLLIVKLGTDCGVTISVLLIVSLHPLAVVIVKITLYVPAVEYV